MPFLPYEAKNFTTPLAIGDSGRLTLLPAELIWGAATVGVTPISMGGVPRPLVELSWRAAMAGASLAEDQISGHWCRSAGYQRLDASEKRAVSYFLGMTQAKITCERLLRTPHLIHLDAYLAMIGQPTRMSRPDLVGISLPSMDCTVAVEAKGRTGARTEKVVRDAKKQASSLPGILSTSEATRVASVASFDTQGQWEAYLEDPPGPISPMAHLTVESLLAAYYRPLVACLVAAGGGQTIEDNAMTLAQLPGIDLALGIPTPIVTIMRALSPGERVSVDRLHNIGVSLLGVTSSFFASRSGSPELDDAKTATPQRLGQYTGLDGVYVGLGRTWQQAFR